MADFYEIDFLDVETACSGDAIALRYELGGVCRIHVVDGGFQQTGEALVRHIRDHYGNPNYLHAVVVTHSDGDHAGGLRTVLEEFEIGELWMLRPWLYTSHLLPHFAKFKTEAGLAARLREIYSNLAALEEIANGRGIPIREPFQGAVIGGFRVLAPSINRYLALVLRSERTPEITEQARSAVDGLGVLQKAFAAAARMLKAAWGVEAFSPEETSAENEMSVVQYAFMNGHRILLTGDAGREALSEAVGFAPNVGLTLPGIDRFQVPHHGSRRNVSTEILDRLLGPRLATQPAENIFTAIISSAKADKDHPRKAVVRAMIHRGAGVVTTEGKTIRVSREAPDRPGWKPVSFEPYPGEQED